MSRSVSRRGLLCGRLSADAASPVRPPWALPEAAFTAACGRGGACIKACPEKIIVKGGGGFPEIDFALGSCTFCGACREACPTTALDLRPKAAAIGRDESEGQFLPWSLKARILPNCLALRGIVCRLCEEACEADAIRFESTLGGAKPNIDSAQCTGCGACYASCPEQAITLSNGAE